jgi:hypothetical protein
MNLDSYLGRQSVSVNHLGIRCGHVCKGAHENLALEAVLNDYVDSVKCTTASDRGYYSSAVAGFTIEVKLRQGASVHLWSLIQIKLDEDTLAEQKKNSKRMKTSNKTCTKKTVFNKK